MLSLYYFWHQVENLENFDFFHICILGKKGKEVRLVILKHTQQW